MHRIDIYKRSELMNKCRHRAPHLLKLPVDPMPGVMVNIYQKFFFKYQYKILTLKPGKVFYEILKKYLL